VLGAAAGEAVKAIRQQIAKVFDVHPTALRRRIRRLVGASEIVRAREKVCVRSDRLEQPAQREGLAVAVELLSDSRRR